MHSSQVNIMSFAVSVSVVGWLWADSAVYITSALTDLLLSHVFLLLRLLEDLVVLELVSTLQVDNIFTFCGAPSKDTGSGVKLNKFRNDRRWFRTLVPSTERPTFCHTSTASLFAM